MDLFARLIASLFFKLKNIKIYGPKTTCGPQICNSWRILHLSKAAKDVVEWVLLFILLRQSLRLSFSYRQQFFLFFPTYPPLSLALHMGNERERWLWFTAINKHFPKHFSKHLNKLEVVGWSLHSISANQQTQVASSHWWLSLLILPINVPLTHPSA